jgi:hypothetical protein
MNQRVIAVRALIMASTLYARVIHIPYCMQHMNQRAIAARALIMAITL